MLITWVSHTGFIKPVNSEEPPHLFMKAIWNYGWLKRWRMNAAQCDRSPIPLSGACLHQPALHSSPHTRGKGLLFFLSAHFWAKNQGPTWLWQWDFKYTLSGCDTGTFFWWQDITQLLKKKKNRRKLLHWREVYLERKDLMNFNQPSKIFISCPFIKLNSHCARQLKYCKLMSCAKCQSRL